MNKLDTMVRQMILRHPLIFTTRWDVLLHLYVHYGTGLRWVDGELVDITGRDDDRTDEQCVAEFFSDIDEFRATFAGPGWREEDEQADTLKRRRRRFVLDNLDLIVHERRIDSGAPFDAARIITGTALDYSPLFHVPDDAEQSFRDGAVEVLGELMPGLYYESECGRDRGIRAAASRELARLVPQPDPAIVERILADIEADARTA